MHQRILSWVLLLLALLQVAFAADGIQVYQRNVFSTPKLANDLALYHHADDIWAAIRQQFSLNHAEYQPEVQAQIAWFLANQQFLTRAMSRSGPYLYYIFQQIKKQHLPAELVLVPIIESGYDPFSMSYMGAAGIWQLMPNTALGLGVKHNWWYDGRRDVVASTHAALNYLAYLKNFFNGNWLLAIAAYNTGEGNILSAIKRNIHARKNTAFWYLPLSQQTRDYVPRLLALAIIISHPDRYPIALPAIKNAPYLAQVDVGLQINLKYAALLAGLSYENLMRLNPGFNRFSTATKGPYKLILPIENVDIFTRNLTSSPLHQEAHGVLYRVFAGDTLLTIAKKFNVHPKDILARNEEQPFVLTIGDKILIPTQGVVASISADANMATVKNIIMHHTTHKMNKKFAHYPVMINQSSNLSAANENYKLKPGDTIYMVRTGDSLTRIAQRYNTTVGTIRLANMLRENVDVREGDKLVIPTHLKG